MSEVEKIKILLVENMDLVSAGLAALISKEPDMEVVGQATDGNEVLQRVHELNPNLVIMDINLPGCSGIDATAQLNENRPEVKVLALSAYEDRYYMQKMLREGATGYLPKRAAVSELIQAIRIVAAGSIYIHPSLSRSFISLMGDNPQQAPNETSKRELSEREKDVLRLIAWGYSNKEIGAKLKIGIKSVDTYKTRLMEKLGIRNRVEIVQYAKRQGLMDEI
jgi:DNA-binding NarL/FixJ family response regulator